MSVLLEFRFMMMLLVCTTHIFIILHVFYDFFMCKCLFILHSKNYKTAGTYTDYNTLDYVPLVLLLMTVLPLICDTMLMYVLYFIDILV